MLLLEELELVSLLGKSTTHRGNTRHMDTGLGKKKPGELVGKINPVLCLDLIFQFPAEDEEDTLGFPQESGAALHPQRDVWTAGT